MTDLIIQVVAQHFNVTKDEMRSDSTKRRIAKARHFVFYFMKTYTKYYLETIGSFLNKDHSSVSYACKIVDEQSSIYPAYMNELMEVNDKIIINANEGKRRVSAINIQTCRPSSRNKYTEVWGENDFFTN